MIMSPTSDNLITISINGESRTVPLASNLSDLCATLGLDAAKIAIEHNRTIAPRGQFAEITLNAGDALEIVHFVGGG